MHASASSLLAQLRQNPQDLSALHALRQLADQAGETASYAEGLELHARALAESGGDPADLGRLHFDLGNLYRDKLGRQDRAIAHYRAAIDFDAAMRPAIVAARGIYAQVGKWDQVAKLLVREADSLPEGPKRAATLQELARVYKDELGDAEGAVRTLREASGYVPNDLHLRHELATLLLELADRESDGFRAEERRREAADVLCAMARAVSDDYAFAYVEAALDAVPDHAPGLSLLEAIAPRVGRNDTVPPRWVAGLQMSPEGPLSRDLRLKLARAYHSVGQEADARACLEPLLARGDAEAARLIGSLKAAPPPESVETLLEDDIVAESSRAEQMASDIDALRSSVPEVASPLDDLARLGRGDQTIVEPLDFGDEGELPGEPSVRADVSSGELTLAGEELADTPTPQTRSVVPGKPSARPDVSALPMHERPTAPGQSLFDSVPDEAELARGLDDTPPTGMELPLAALAAADAHTTSSHAAKDVQDLLRQSLAEVPDEGEGHDPHSEVTQPRGGMEIPAEARRSVPSDTPERPSGGVARPRLGKPEPRASADLASASQPLNDLAQLRKELEKRIRFRDRRGAADIAEQMLAHDGTDAEAIAALEDHYRTTRDFKRMRELSMRIGREAALPDETRITRLREAAMLSESKLGDLEGTMTAWRALLSLLPHDDEGNAKLRKLYARHARWDDLAQMIEGQADKEEDTLRRAGLFREVGLVHRDKRKAPDAAIDAFQKARDLEPGRADDDVVLSELFEAAGRHAEAALAYEARLNATEEPVERIPLLRTLAELYETELGDDTHALACTDALLVIAPRDSESLDRLERIAERTNQPERVIDALTRKLQSLDSGSQSLLHARIGEIALHKLADPVRAAQAYRDALMRSPTDAALQSAAEEAFERADKRAELTELFVMFAHNAREPSVRAALLRKVAERERQDGRLEAAIAAYEQLLIVSKDQGALATLVELLRQTERHAELSVRLEALANASAPAVARDLRIERARLFADKLSRLDSAKAELTRVLTDLAPQDVEVLTLLAEYAQRTNDLPLFAHCEEQRMALLDTAEARIEVAERLAALFEGELKDDDGAIRVLEFWMREASGAPQPYLKLVPLYERTGKDRELLSALDALATLAVAEDEAAEYLLRAARVAMKSGDHEGAWNRLVPRVVDADDAQAETLLRELAQLSGRGTQLAELFVGLAQRQGDVAFEKRRWMDAAQVYETMASAPDKALEAMLRALAKDSNNSTLLDEADRLAELARAWPRLTQVYDALARRAESPDLRIRLLMRLAERLESKARDLPGAFERAALAFQIDPARDETYLEAKRLARASDKLEELLAVHERRSSGAAELGARMEALLEACAVAQHAVGDPPRATGYLSRAVAMVAGDEALLADIEAQVRELDARQPPIDGRGLTFALAGVYKARAEDEKRTPQLSSLLLMRASQLYTEHLDDRESAYRTLERAATLTPSDDPVLDALVAAAERAGRFEALAQHFQKLSDDAIDSTTASAALRRLGALFRGPLRDPNRAAEVFKQLVMLRPRDTEASSALRACLKEAGRHKDLLIALDRELTIAASHEERVAFLREAAETWERGLENRFEARDAWKKVLALSPDDTAAQEAMERLGSRASIDERSLLESDVVVLPEDLHPTLPPPEPDAPAPVEIVGAPEGDAPREAHAEASADTHDDEPSRDATDPGALAEADQGPASTDEFDTGAAVADVADEDVEDAPYEAAPASPSSDEDERWPEPVALTTAPAPSLAAAGEDAWPAAAPVEPIATVEEASAPAADEPDPDDVAETHELTPRTAVAAVEAAVTSEAVGQTQELTPADLIAFVPSEGVGQTQELTPADLIAFVPSEGVGQTQELTPADLIAFVPGDARAAHGGPSDEELSAERLAMLTEPAPAPDTYEELEGEALDADEALLPSGEVSLDELVPDGASATELPSERRADTDPSELAASAPATEVPPAPPVPWAEADRPSQTGKPRPDLLADLEALDDAEVEPLESSQVDLEAIEEEPAVDEPAPAGLESLNSMLERAGSQAPKVSRIPPPPGATLRPGGSSVPPPVPVRPTAPPPVPGSNRPAGTPPPPPPSPPRRS